MGQDALPHPEATRGPLAEVALEECLRLFPFVRLSVTGACMSPSLAQGEKVLVTSVARRPPGFGDVVLLRQGTELRLHRLVAAGSPIARLRFRTQADRSPTPDPRHPRARLLGTVIAVEGDSQRPVRSVGAALRSLTRALAGRARAFLGGGRG